MNKPNYLNFELKGQHLEKVYHWINEYQSKKGKFDIGIKFSFTVLTNGQIQLIIDEAKKEDLKIHSCKEDEFLEWERVIIEYDNFG